jgi:hypothetical protein
MVPRREAPCSRSTGWLRCTDEIQGPVYRAQRLAEEFERARSLLPDGHVTEVAQEPVEDTRALHDRVGEDIVHRDTALGENAHDILGVRGDERLSKIFRYVLQQWPPCSDTEKIPPTIDGVRTKPEDPMRKYLFIFALFALALSACRVESNVVLSIEEDGSGTVGFELGMDQEFRDLMEQSGGSLDDILTDLPDFGGQNVTPTNRVDGDMTYIGVESVVDDISAFDFSADGGEFFSAFSYEFDRKTASLTATISSGDIAGDAGDLPFDMSSLTGEFFSANVVISMPGTVVEHNADEVLGDGTLVWEIPLSGSADIFAKSSFGSSSNSWIVWVLGLVLLVGVVAAVTATIVSRKESKKAVAAAASASVDTMPPPPLEETQELETPASDPTVDASPPADTEATTAATELGGTDTGDGDEPDETATAADDGDGDPMRPDDGSQEGATPDTEQGANGQPETT